MFGKIRRELVGIRAEIAGLQNALVHALRDLNSSDGYEGLRNRLDALEGPLQAKLGEVEGIIRKADGLKHAAASAESRTRGLLARTEKLASDIAEDDESDTPLTREELHEVLSTDGGRSPSPGMPTVPSVMDQLLEQKWGSG